jgi:hypothetical protein
VSALKKNLRWWWLISLEVCWKKVVVKGNVESNEESKVWKEGREEEKQMIDFFIRGKENERLCFKSPPSIILFTKRRTYDSKGGGISSDSLLCLPHFTER